MTRLITFGCSWTYGHGLEDCFVDGQVGPNPSKFAWPSLLGNELNIETINKSSPGSSNLKMLNEVLNYDFLSDDTVVILWSFPYRDMLFDPSSNINIGSWISGDVIKDYYKVHTNHDMMMKSVLSIHHCDLHLRYKGIKILHATRNGLLSEFIQKSLKSDSLKWFNTPIYFFHRTRHIDFALDNSHPGPKTHMLMSKLLLKKLKEMNEH